MRQEKIKDILERNLKIKLSNKTDMKLIDIKDYDSMNLVQIIMEIQGIDNKQIPLEKLNKIITISDLLEL